MTPLTVASFNVRNSRAFDWHNSWIFRRSIAAAAIEKLGADVVGLQEVFASPRDYLLKHLTNYVAAGDGRSGNDRGEHCCVFASQPRLELIESKTRWFGDSPDTPGSKLPGAGFPRVATRVRLVDRVSSMHFDVWNLHLDERVHENRVRSIAQLVTWLDADEPTVVLGDFNAETDHAEVFAPLKAQGFRAVLTQPSVGSAHQFTGGTDGPLIDHIFVCGRWCVDDAAVVTTRPKGRLPSDHWPVRAILRLAP